MIEALSLAGFSRYFPAQGILHQRRHTKKSLSIETKKNRELIFDFMDAYRAPFRYYLLLTFLNNNILIKNRILATLKQSQELLEWYQTNALTISDFHKVLDEWHRRVYFPTTFGEQKLAKLFNLICKEHFSYKLGKKPLEEIMIEEAKTLANFLLEKTIKHEVFTALNDEDSLKSVFNYYKIIDEILR